MTSGMRIDKWLWFTRATRSRTLAASLVEEGRVRINREKVTKPSHVVRVGDVVTASANWAETGLIMFGSDFYYVRQTPAELRHELAEDYIETEVLYNFSFRIISMQNSGQIPNYEASMNKMFGSELAQRVGRTGTKVFGLFSTIWQDQQKWGDRNAPYSAIGSRSSSRC